MSELILGEPISFNNTFLFGLISIGNVSTDQITKHPNFDHLIMVTDQIFDYDDSFRLYFDIRLLDCLSDNGLNYIFFILQRASGAHQICSSIAVTVSDKQNRVIMEGNSTRCNSMWFAHIFLPLDSTHKPQRANALRQPHRPGNALSRRIDGPRALRVLCAP